MMRVFLSIVILLVLAKHIRDNQRYPSAVFISFMKFMGQLILTMFVIGVFVLTMLCFFFGHSRP